MKYQASNSHSFPRQGKNRSLLCQATGCKASPWKKCHGSYFCFKHDMELCRIRKYKKERVTPFMELSYRLQEVKIRGCDAGHLYRILILSHKCNLTKCKPSLQECGRLCRELNIREFLNKYQDTITSITI